ncbi:urease accessory protein UreD [Roseibium sp.]|uniref:urease accessory protein UreD n=1 Tax=Roseibium sp. TaxID=1936156 RepID=UPI003A96A1BB
MFDADDGKHSNNVSAPMQRVKGAARVSYQFDGTATRLDDLYQSGSAKVRLPKVYDGVPAAVLINTAGGITGGDRLSYEASLGEDAHALVTTQTAERAYRRTSGVGSVATRLTVAAGATLEWLPQEAILFNASALHRSLTADLAGNSRLLALESVVLGRSAMGERVDTLSYRDRWRIRRDGKLVFADDVRLEGDPTESLKGIATTAGKIAFATFFDCAVDAEDRIDLARSALGTCAGQASVHAAASAWNGLLIARFVANDGQALRSRLMSFLKTYRSAELPRVWHC